MRSFIITYLLLILFSLQATAYIDPNTFAIRREKIMQQLDGGIFILNAAQDLDVNRHEYRQDNYFWYLTGFNEAYAIMVLDPVAKERYILFIPEPHFIAQIYGGRFPSLDELGNQYLADTVISLRQFPQFLRSVVDNGRTIYSITGSPDFLRRISGIQDDIKVSEISSKLDEMRLVKDSVEIEMTRKAIAATRDGLLQVFQVCKPGMFEYEIEAVIEYNFRKAGSSMPAFRSIVGSGSNATILHYDENNRQMQDGDLLLMDVGAEYKMYAADITRTIPVNGKFNKEQREIYELVLRAEEEAIKVMKPGIGNLVCNQRAIQVITQGLIKLGLMTDSNAVWQKKLYNLYRVNHWLGLDVHDVGSFGPESYDFRTYMFNPEVKGRPFESGMISTIEPGIYFRPDLFEKLRQFAGDEVPQNELNDFLKKVKPVYEKYMNIGIRIEDDILITSSGNEILSSGIPKTISEIEVLMK